MKEIEEGMILLQNTCNEIKIDMKGKATRINEHTEHWLIQEIKKDNVVLYNLDNQRTMKIERKTLINMLTGINKYNIKPMFTISNERA